MARAYRETARQGRQDEWLRHYATPRSIPVCHAKNEPPAPAPLDPHCLTPALSFPDANAATRFDCRLSLIHLPIARLNSGQPYPSFPSSPLCN
eukprot:6179474-Pleurochrysis_carterae.AAC.4